MAISVGALPFLEEMLRSPQTDVQEAAAAALSKLQHADSASQGQCACTFECALYQLFYSQKKGLVLMQNCAGIILRNALCTVLQAPSVVMECTDVTKHI